MDGDEFSVTLIKVDREKLYGTVEIEAFDERGDAATLKVLAADGNTLINKGGTALEPLDEDGNSLERDKLKAVDREGAEIKPLVSSFDQTNKLVPAEIDDYLSLIVKSVYLLGPFESSSMTVLIKNLAAGNLYSFPFSYRDGIESDDAFLVGNKKYVFMVVGDAGTFDFVKLNQNVVLDAGEEQEIVDDDIDFDLL